MTTRLLRVGVFLVLGMTWIGCTTTQTVSRTDPGALAQLTDDLRGKSVEIEYDHRRVRGSGVRLQVDTTQWYSKNGAARFVPTDRVKTLVVDPSLSNTSNATLGFVAGAAFAVAVTDCGGFLSGVCDILYGFIGGLVGAAVFDIVGDAGVERVEYRLRK